MPSKGLVNESPMTSTRGRPGRFVLIMVFANIAAHVVIIRC